MFDALGAAAWSARAEAALVRIAPVAAGHALTPTEARVADLVASGHSNNAVAAQLYMSVKTVEASLSRIFAKLDVRSRTELATRRFRRGGWHGVTAAPKRQGRPIWASEGRAQPSQGWLLAGGSGVSI